VWAVAFYVLIGSAFLGGGVLKLPRMHGITTIKIIIFYLKCYFVMTYLERNSGDKCIVTLMSNNVCRLQVFKILGVQRYRFWLLLRYSIP
jgi:hypothetical protein